MQGRQEGTSMKLVLVFVVPDTPDVAGWQKHMLCMLCSAAVDQSPEALGKPWTFRRLGDADEIGETVFQISVSWETASTAGTEIGESYCVWTKEKKRWDQRVTSVLLARVQHPVRACSLLEL
jgi:hypothetical protein